jgi:hypothetical protein
MDALKAWIQDRKNLPIVLAGTVIIIAIAVLVVLKMSGAIGGGSANVPSQTYPTSMPGQPGAPAGGTVDLGGVPIPQPTALPGAPQMMPTPGMPAAPSTAPGQVSAQAKLAPMLPYREDPFMPISGRPRVREGLMMVLADVMKNPPRLAPMPVVKETGAAAQAEVLPPQPFRRMAGVMWNGKVSAILETNGEADVVRPGMELTRGNSRVRVESIQPNCIILTTMDTRSPMTIKVNMAGSVNGGGTQSTPNYPSGPGLEMEPAFR